ncbi:MAG: YggS family pyridoxal phosphate-dependent enzyme [Hyphomicrobiales bacterium]
MATSQGSNIANHDRLVEIRRRIDTAAIAAGRRRASVTLMAVSKTFDADAIRPVLKAGQRVFGENRVQEASRKWPALREQFSSVELHLIGPLQSNKVGDAVALFDCIQTLDRPKLARALAREMARQNRSPILLVQVNTGEEAQKSGVPPNSADAFIRLCREECGLVLAGLMCIPPAGDDPVVHFNMLGEIAGRNGLAELSMGMSNDFEAAISCGATMVRVGAAIFGVRRKDPS